MAIVRNAAYGVLFAGMIAQAAPISRVVTSRWYFDDEATPDSSPSAKRGTIVLGVFIGIFCLFGVAMIWLMCYCHSNADKKWPQYCRSRRRVDRRDPRVLPPVIGAAPLVINVNQEPPSPGTKALVAKTARQVGDTTRAAWAAVWGSTMRTTATWAKGIFTKKLDPSWEAERMTVDNHKSDIEKVPVCPSSEYDKAAFMSDVAPPSRSDGK